jgi:hypothetical protein
MKSGNVLIKAFGIVGLKGDLVSKRLPGLLHR